MRIYSDLDSPDPEHKYICFRSATFIDNWQTWWEGLSNHDAGTAGPGGEHGPHPGGAALLPPPLTSLGQQEDQLLNVRLAKGPIFADQQKGIPWLLSTLISDKEKLS